MMPIITDEEFFEKLKSFVLWEAFKHTKGEKITFAAFVIDGKFTCVLCGLKLEIGAE